MATAIKHKIRSHVSYGSNLSAYSNWIRRCAITQARKKDVVNSKMFSEMFKNELIKNGVLKKDQEDE